MLLFIADPNWEKTGQEVTHRGKTYHVRYKPRLENCPACGTSSLSRHGWNESDYIDLPVGNQATILKAKVPRFLCAGCQRVVSQKPDGLSKNHRITEKCHEFILASRYKYPRVVIARMTGLCESTINRILAEADGAKLEGQLSDIAPACVPEEIQIRRYVPRQLAIDEIYLGRKKYITLVDREKSRLLDILETEGTREADCAALDKFFDAADKVDHIVHEGDDGEIYEVDLDLPLDRITMDMCYVFRDYFKNRPDRFPKPEIVLDRWHVEKALTKRFTKILAKNIGMQADGPPSGTGAEFEALGLQSRVNKVLRAKFANICRKTATKGDDSPSLEKLRRLLLAYPQIIPAWEYRQRFNEIWSCQTREDAEKRFIRWRSRIPAELVEYKEFAREFSEKKWYHEFINYFEINPSAKATNAVAESMNDIIRSCFNRRKGIGNLEEFRRAAFADSIKNRPPASCRFCGEACYRDLADTSDDPKYFNRKQLKPTGRPRKTWGTHTYSLVDVECEQCVAVYNVYNYENWEDAPDTSEAIQPVVEKNEPSAARELEDFLDELRDEPRYRDWVRGGKKLSPIPPKNKKRRRVNGSDDGQQGVLQFD